MRIGGLASGMDIDTIVGDLMKAERMPVNKLHQKRQLLEWKRDDYRSMNKTLADFDKFIFEGIARQATFLKKSVTSSNEAAVSVKNVNSTSNMTSSINVHRLAEAAYMTGTDVRSTTSGATFDPNGKLVDQRGNLATDFTTNTFTIQSIKADGTMGTAVDFTIDPANDSLNSIISRINNSTAGVVAFYDTQTGKMSITAKNTGDANGSDEIIISDGDGIANNDFLTGSMKLDANSSVAAGASRGKIGVNADFTINGLRTTRPSNTFQINGFEYALKAVSTTDIRISSTTDTDAIFKSVLEFVNKYNETIATVNKELDEEKYRKYQPLTNEEKEAMSEKQLEMWEEKARSGMLKNDSILSSGLTKMRTDLYARVGTDTDDVNNSYDQLSEIGIKTSNNYLDKGKLVIDENKLREAITNDPNAIYKLFNNESTDPNSQGLARRLRTTIKDTTDEIEKRAGNSLRTNQQFTIGRDLISVDKRIDSFEDRLLKIEDRYWRQFTAMEKAIQKANSQSAYLMQQFSA